MPQLKMIFNALNTPMPELEIAGGFTLRTVQDSELEQYNELRQSVNFPAWDVETLQKYRSKVLPDSMMLIVEMPPDVLPLPPVLNLPICPICPTSAFSDGS